MLSKWTERPLSQRDHATFDLGLLGPWKASDFCYPVMKERPGRVARLCLHLLWNHESLFGCWTWAGRPQGTSDLASSVVWGRISPQCLSPTARHFNQLSGYIFIETRNKTMPCWISFRIIIEMCWYWFSTYLLSAEVKQLPFNYFPPSSIYKFWVWFELWSICNLFVMAWMGGKYMSFAFWTM